MAAGPNQPMQRRDRECLVTLMKNYPAALVKHDPSAVPFAQEVKFVENTENIPADDGLCVTASGEFTMPVIHFFKIKKGKIYDSEATGFTLPYGTKPGWE